MTKSTENSHAGTKTSEAVKVAKQAAKTGANPPKPGRQPTEDYEHRDRFGRNESH